MTISSRMLGRSVLPALAALATACAGSGAGRGPAGYVHRYALEPGDVLRFETVATSSIDSEMLAMVMPGPIEMRMPAVTRIDILEHSGDDLTGEMCIEEHSIEGPDELVGGMSGLLGSMDISDRSFPFTLQPSGRSDMAVEFGGISIGGGNAMTSQGLSQYFIPWPEKPIEAGESWTDSTTQESAFGESGAVSITIVTHYTYLGLVESETGGAPAHTVQARAEGSMAGNTTTAAMGMDVEMMMTSTWTGESEYRFDPRDGLLDEGSTTVTMEMTLDFVAPMTMSMPMSMTSTTSTRRRR